MKSVATVLALALAAGTALAQPADRPMRHGNQAQMGGPMAMMQKLNLTDEQQTQMRKLRVDFQKKQIQKQAKIRLARLDLSQMLLADKPDRPAIEKAIRDISSIETDSKLARVDHMMAVRTLLTPEQQKLWKEQMMNRRGAMRGRMGMMRQHGLGMMGEILPPADADLSDLAAMPELIDPPDAAWDDMEPGDIDIE